jgi:hypothetical protein
VGDFSKNSRKSFTANDGNKPSGAHFYNGKAATDDISQVEGSVRSAQVVQPELCEKRRFEYNILRLINFVNENYARSREGGRFVKAPDLWWARVGWDARLIKFSV